MSNKRVAIIGGGIAGLAAAISLVKARPDLEVTIFESTGRAGGVLETIYDGPYLIERSADNFATLIPDALELCKMTGYGDQLISRNPMVVKPLCSIEAASCRYRWALAWYSRRACGRFSLQAL